jgi:hypothetical protein
VAEHEVTRLITLVSAMAEEIGIEPAINHPELAELAKDVDPERVLDQIEQKSRTSSIAIAILSSAQPTDTIPRQAQW